MKPGDLPERFASKIQVAANGCWLWTGARHGEGYGHFWNEGGMVLAHRFAYERFFGAIPSSLTIDHVRERGCSSRLCVNPAHLEVVTVGENSLRGEHPNFVAFRAGTCQRGHDASHFYRRKRGARAGEVAYCGACRAEGKVAA